MRKMPFKTCMTEEDLRNLGLTSWAAIPAEEIVFSQEVRDMCAANQCGKYGTTWACPPAVGTLEECREKCLQYSSAFVFSAVYPLEDSFDFEGMMEGHDHFQCVCRKLRGLLEEPFLLLSNEGCARCKTCTYPDAPCRFPDELSPSVEGYGIFVTQLAKRAGIPYYGGPNTVTYFGLVCFD